MLSRLVTVTVASVAAISLAALLLGSAPGWAGGGNDITSPDTAGDVGMYTSLTLDENGYPVVSYVDDTNDDLKILHCGDARCSSGNIITSPDTTGAVGFDTSLVLDGNGYPVVTYRDFLNGTLKVLHCGDPNCGAGNVIGAPDAIGQFGGYTSLALDENGYPVVSYYDDANDDLRVMHCGDANCTFANFVASPDTAGDVGKYTSLALDQNGNPVVSYIDDSDGDLDILHCGDANCSDDNVIAVPDPTRFPAFGTSLVLDGNGYPVVSYFALNASDLVVIHCGDPTCSTDNAINRPDTQGSTGLYPSLALDGNGYPVISYHDDTNGDLRVLHCGDPDCSASTVNTIASPDTEGVVGWYTSLALDAGGNPVVSYYDDTNEDLKVLRCGDPYCGAAQAALVWGDANCSGEADPIDSLLTLRNDAGLSTNTGGCPGFGQSLDVQIAALRTWGDVDCGGDITPIDSLKLLRYDAGLSVSQAAGCPAIGSAVTIGE